MSAALRWLCMGGLSLLCMAALALTRPPVDRVIALAALANWVINWPHFAATSYRLYGDRRRRAQFPVTTLGTPLLMLLAVIAALREPRELAPALVKLYWLWSPYHFCAQSLGLCLLYARVRSPTPGERRLLVALALSIYVASVAVTEAGSEGYRYFGMALRPLGLPGWFRDGALWLCHGLLCLTLWRCRRLPALALFLLGVQYLWFVPGRRVPGMPELVPLFHSLQYLALATELQIQEGQVRRFALWSLALGALLFYALPRAAQAAGSPAALAFPVVLSGVQMHHFFVDGVIWKLRSLPDRPGCARPPAGSAG